MARSAAFGVMHLGIAFGVSCALTGGVAVAGPITRDLPAVDTVAHDLADRCRARRGQGGAACRHGS